MGYDVNKQTKKKENNNNTYGLHIGTSSIDDIV
jgi:hypothetical protein